MPIHKQLAAGRWFTLTLAEQLGNVGSEVERTIRAAEAGDPERKALACTRALELLDLTLADPRRAGEQEQAELRRLRETLCDVFQGENASGTTFASLNDYFLEWGTVARAGR
jgi:hypothetical protein